MYISSLRSHIEAMGGELEIVAHLTFADQVIFFGNVESGKIGKFIHVRRFSTWPA